MALTLGEGETVQDVVQHNIGTVTQAMREHPTVEYQVHNLVKIGTESKPTYMTIAGAYEVLNNLQNNLPAISSETKRIYNRTKRSDKAR